MDELSRRRLLRVGAAAGANFDDGVAVFVFRDDQWKPEGGEG